jgi:hypothetical protein
LSVGSETPLIEFVCCVTVALKMAERAGQLHRDNASANSTALLPAFLAKYHITQVWLLVFPKAKIAFKREEICECDGHTVHKLSQRRLTAD